MLTDTNQGMVDVYSNPADTSLADYDDEESGDEGGQFEIEDGQMDGNAEEEEERIGSGGDNVDDDVEQEDIETEVVPAAKIVAKPHAKRSAARSQLQAINQLAAGVSKLAEVNAKRLKVEEKDRHALLAFRREEAGEKQKTRESDG